MDLVSLFIASAIILIGALVGSGIGFGIAHIINKLLGGEFQKNQLLYVISMALCASAILRIIENNLKSYGFPQETILLSFIIAGIAGIPLIIVACRKKNNKNFK